MRSSCCRLSDVDLMLASRHAPANSVPRRVVDSPDVRRKVSSPMVEFRISSFCNFGNCVEVGMASDGSVVVRDSKDADRRRSLEFTGDEWAAFVAGVKAGEFDTAR